jgi:hypothetical protein
MTTDPLATSAETWVDHAADPPAIDPRLTPPVDATPVERFAAWRMRHHLRRVEADRVYLDSRSPERGWPVAGDRAVLRFFRDLISERRRMFAALVVLNGMAAATGLVVPRLLGTLVDHAFEGIGAELNRLAVLVVVVVCAQALFTFLAQWTSTLFGQELLASAREYIVRTILRLPLGQVESASTGDLVTRVTHLDADGQPLGRGDAAELGAARGALAAGDRFQLLRRPQLPATGPQGIHQRGLDLLAHQHHPHRDGRGRTHRRGARAGRPTRAPG